MNNPDIGPTGHHFLAGGGEMGELIRAYDWANSSLGEPGNWPQSLKAMLRLLLSSGHPMFIWWGPDLIQFYNDEYRRSIGPERHPSALGQEGRKCWVEIWSIIGPQIEQVMTGGGATWNENQLVPITRYGKREDVYWTYSYSPIDDPNAPKGIGGVLVVCTETTAQVMAEQQKKLAEARWRELFMQTPGFTCILNGPEHRFEFANPRYFSLVGNRDIIGKSVHEALPEIADQGFKELLDEVYRSGKAYSGVAVPITLDDVDGKKQQLYLDFVYQPIFNSHDQVTGIFVSGYDVSERVCASEILREEDRRKDEFLAMLAHELRNPLAPILNAGELLKQSYPEDSDLYAKGRLITRQVTHLTRLVDDLLDISRITEGRIELQLKPVDLDTAIKLALESVQIPVQEKQHQLTYPAGEQKIYVNGDAIRIIQCLSNILTNAAKYTAAGGHIDINLKADGPMAIIDISDNGIGIEQDMLGSIFDLFVQADKTLDRSKGGLGIGLSIVRKLVHMHGGQVTAHSNGLGKGSRFRIAIPLTETPATVASKPVPTSLPSMRLLIVDDNADAADSLAQLLQLKGHTTLAVYTAHDALAQAVSFAADIMLLDIGLPDMDGYEVARQLRANDYKRILIALTGYGQAKDIQRAKDAGFDSHVTKPIIFDDLERILEQYRGQASIAG